MYAVIHTHKSNSNLTLLLPNWLMMSFNGILCDKHWFFFLSLSYNEDLKMSVNDDCTVYCSLCVCVMEPDS